MIEFETQVKNKIGVHLRAAGEFVKTATKFKSEIFVVKNGKKANGKSILGLASLAIERGARITVRIDGRDEIEARTAIEELIDNNFNEE
jgi:phosphocarrier protein